MIYVVTGLCLLVSFAICVFSLVYAENRKQKEAVLEAVEASEESSEEQKSEDKKIGENSDEENKGTKQDASPCTTFFYKIKTLTVWQWVIFVLISIASSALLCLETVWIQSNSNNWITIIKLFLTMEMLISASIIDKQIKKIPNKLVVSAYLIRVILFVPEYFLFNDTFFRVLMGSVFGFAISFFVFFLMSILTKSGIGMGDVKLVSAMGCLIGLSGTFFSVFYGMVVCMFMAIGFIAFKKRKVKDKIAFAPFIDIINTILFIKSFP